jgi:hypothetical protein
VNPKKRIVSNVVAKYVAGPLRKVQALKAKRLDLYVRASVEHPTMLDEELRAVVQIQLDAERRRSQP